MNGRRSCVLPWYRRCHHHWRRTGRVRRSRLPRVGSWASRRSWMQLRLQSPQPSLQLQQPAAAAGAAGRGRAFRDGPGSSGTAACPPTWARTETNSPYTVVTVALALLTSSNAVAAREAQRGEGELAKLTPPTPRSEGGERRREERRARAGGGGRGLRPPRSLLRRLAGPGKRGRGRASFASAPSLLQPAISRLGVSALLVPELLQPDQDCNQPCPNRVPGRRAVGSPRLR